MCNNGFGGGGCCWIIIIILLLICCCGCGGGCGNGCGCNKWLRLQQRLRLLSIDTSYTKRTALTRSPLFINIR